MNRLDVLRQKGTGQVKEHEFWPTYEVFVQNKRGKKHEHVGSLHAPDHEMAVVLAKEQFGRRQAITNIWVCKTTDITATNYEDEDMFANNMEKTYREASGFKSRDKITAYKEKMKAQEP